MKSFLRDDGVELVLDPDLKRAILGRPSANPKSHWTDQDYALGARTKLERWRRRLARLHALNVRLDGARVLDLACGNGIDCILMGLEPVKSVIGMDLNLPLFAADKVGARHRRLAAEVLSAVGRPGDCWSAVCELPVCMAEGDARNLPFAPGSFDLILSNSFLEHVIPIEAALSEMHRVLAPGGFMYHVIDPYYWLRGCHAPGLVDIPWAHARLSPPEYRRFVVEHEGEQAAQARCEWLGSLNHFSLETYRGVFAASPFKILDWQEARSSLAEDALARHPHVLASVVPGVGREDLVCDSIRVLARKGS